MSFFLFIWVCCYNEQQTDFFLTVCLVTKPFFTSQWMYGVARAVRLKPRLQVPDIIQNLPGVDKLESSEQARAKQVAILMRFISVDGDGHNFSFWALFF